MNVRVFRNTTGTSLQPGQAVMWASSAAPVSLSAMTALTAPVVEVSPFWTWPTLQEATYDELNLGWWFEDQQRRVFLGKKDVLCCRDEKELRAIIQRTPGVLMTPKKTTKPDPEVAVAAPPIRKIVLED